VQIVVHFVAIIVYDIDIVDNLCICECVWCVYRTRVHKTENNIIEV